LLFTVSEEQKGLLETNFANANIKATCVGQLTGMAEKLELRENDQAYDFSNLGYEHF
jgi:thiamine-monophosphate kinase